MGRCLAMCVSQMSEKVFGVVHIWHGTHLAGNTSDTERIWPSQTASESSQLCLALVGTLYWGVWIQSPIEVFVEGTPGPTFIKPDQLDPWIKDQIKITLLPTISHLLLPNFVSCGRACPSHMTQNLVTVGAKLWTAERFLVDPWSMDYADPVW